MRHDAIMRQEVTLNKEIIYAEMGIPHCLLGHRNGCRRELAVGAPKDEREGLIMYIQRLGAEGWELVLSHDAHLYFKRPKMRHPIDANVECASEQ